MQPKTIVNLTMAGAFVYLGVVNWPHIGSRLLAGWFPPTEIIETLQNPIAVAKWTSDGLRLADGRTVQLPGLRSLPSESAALSEATKRGVEISATGRVWGLVEIHEWCGNDPVQKRILRIDLAEMMTFLHVGEPIVPVPAREAEFFPREPGGTFTRFGWRIDEYFGFQCWQSIKKSTQRIERRARRQ